MPEKVKALHLKPKLRCAATHPKLRSDKQAPHYMLGDGAAPQNFIKTVSVMHDGNKLTLQITQAYITCK